MKGLRNRVQLYGLVGRVYNIVESSEGNKVALFSLVTTERYTAITGDDVEETSSHIILATGKIADAVEKRVGPATEMILEGRLTYRKRKDGSNYTPTIEIHEMIVFSRKFPEAVIL